MHFFEKTNTAVGTKAVGVIAVNRLSSSLLDPSTQECNGSSLQASAPVCVLLGS